MSFDKFFLSLIGSIVDSLVLLAPAITPHLKLCFIRLTKQFNLETEIIGLKYLLINLLNRKSLKNICRKLDNSVDQIQ